MEGNGRNIHEIAPEVVNETQEHVTDAYIEQVLLRHKADESEVAFLEAHKGECAERISRLEVVSAPVDEFLQQVEDTFPEGTGERARAREALTVMLKLHINQKDRLASGLPFISHPLAVAQRVLSSYKEHDASHVVAAALLHDAIEDQSRLLMLEQKLADHKEYDVSKKLLERSNAIAGLGQFFGMRVATLVTTLTSPGRLGKESISQEDKNDIYAAYVHNIFFNKEDAAVSVIKWADLQENAWIGDLYERAQQLEAAGKSEEAAHVLNFYQKMKKKYEPILYMVRDFFENLSAEHPLYEEREEAIEKINVVLATQYNLA